MPGRTSCRAPSKARPGCGRSCARPPRLPGAAPTSPPPTKPSRGAAAEDRHHRHRTQTAHPCLSPAHRHRQQRTPTSWEGSPSRLPLANPLASQNSSDEALSVCAGKSGGQGQDRTADLPLFRRIRSVAACGRVWPDGRSSRVSLLSSGVSGMEVGVGRSSFSASQDCHGFA
jgi:hypothetical protein